MHEALAAARAVAPKPAVTTHRVLVLGGGAAGARLLDLARCSTPDGAALELFALDGATGRAVAGGDVLLHADAATELPAVSSVLRALDETKADLLVAGYPQHARARSVFTDVVERATAAASLDVMVCIDRHERPWQRVLVPYLYGPLDRGALDVARRIARTGDARVTVLHVEEPRHGDDSGDYLRASIGGCALRIVTAEDPVVAAAAEARQGYDLIVLGGGERRARGRYFTMRQQRLLLATDATLVIVHSGRHSP